MNSGKRRAVALAAILLIGSVAVSAQPAVDPYRKGKSCLEEGDFVSAIASLTEAIRLDPDLPDAYYNRGLARRRKGELDGAIKDYGEAIRLNPEFADAYYGRGITYGKKGELDKAVADFTEAIRLNPKDAEAYWGRACVYAEFREFRTGWPRAVACPGLPQTRTCAINAFGSSSYPFATPRYTEWTARR